jgi:hypothetical protein
LNLNFDFAAVYVSCRSDRDAFCVTPKRLNLATRRGIRFEVNVCLVQAPSLNPPPLREFSMKQLRTEARQEPVVNRKCKPSCKPRGLFSVCLDLSI